MTLTLLLDLDDTLLDSNMDEFIPVYFGALAKAMSKYVEPEKLLKFLMQGTNAMIANDTPEETLEEVFAREFYPNLDEGRDILDPALVSFYEEVFPTLAYLTKPRPEAVELVEWAFAQGYRVAVSTNPLFPRAAIYHRLRWAGLDPDEYPFEVISSYEHFHFCKPNPAYFAEILGRTGWHEGSVLVVGDDAERDIHAAEELGVARYWIANDDAVLPNGSKVVWGRGKIGDLRAQIEAAEGKMPLPQYQAQSAIVATVKAIPAALQGLLADLPTGTWTASPDPKEWSLVEVVCHLRDVEREVNFPRIQTFLSEVNPFITAEDTDLWADDREYAKQDGEAALRDFIAARMETLEELKKLKDEDWQGAGRHAVFGPITLHEQLGFMAEHDRVHIRQIYEVVQRIL